MAKHILFMNATYIHKLKSFQTAKELGLTVSVVGPELPDWVRPYVDYFIEAQTHSEQVMRETLEVLRAAHAGRPFDGVIAFWDHGVVPAAQVAQTLGLPGNSVRAAEQARNEGRMRQALERHDVPHPGFARVSSWEELLRASKTLGYPLIYKPAGGAGSAGVLKIESEAELRCEIE